MQFVHITPFRWRWYANDCMSRNSNWYWRSMASADDNPGEGRTMLCAFYARQNSVIHTINFLFSMHTKWRWNFFECRQNKNIVYEYLTENESNILIREKMERRNDNGPSARASPSRYHRGDALAVWKANRECVCERESWTWTHIHLHRIKDAYRWNIGAYWKCIWCYWIRKQCAHRKCLFHINDAWT